MQSSSSGVLLVAPWGNPFSWNLALYRVDNVSVSARTSLEALAELYGPSVKRILVFVLDTVVAAQADKNCSRDIGPRSPGSFASYRELESYVVRRVEEWVRGCCSCPRLVEAFENNVVRMVVVPGAGRFSPSSSTDYWFFGSAGACSTLSGFEAFAAIHVLRELLDTNASSIVLDLTHGINYMPALMLEAVMEAAKAYVVARGVASLRLEVYNSEPYPLPKPQQSPELAIHLINSLEVGYEEAVVETAVKLNQAVELVKGVEGFKAPWCYADTSAKHRLGRQLGHHLDVIKGIARLGVAASRALLYSMPLALAHLARDIAYSYNYPGEGPLETLYKAINSVIDVLKDNAIIDAGRKAIRHALTLNPANLEPFIWAAVLLENTLRVTSVDPLNWKPENGLSLEKLREIAENTPSPYKAVALSELHQLKENCVGVGGEKCPITIGSEWPGERCDVSSMDTRNLKAHAGLERNIVEARIRQGVVEVRYRVKGDCWRKLYSVLIKQSF